MIPKTVKIKALSGFASLGLHKDNEPRLYSVMRQWLGYQKTLQGCLLNGHLGTLKHGITPNQVEDLQGRFFISVHFGLYPLMISYLATLRPKQKIVCLVGKQKSLPLLQQLAHNNNVDIRFIEIGESFMFFRKCLNAVREDCIFLSFIDIPLGVSEKSDVKINFLNGEMRIRTGLFKLADKLGLKPRFIISGYSPKDNTVPVNSYSVDSAEQAFSIFERYIKNQPHNWDKIIDLKKFYTGYNDGLYIPFILAGHYFALDVKNDKILQVNSSLYEQICSIKNGRLSEEEIKKKRALIYDKTSLYIRKAI
ncbi:hypothetical protein [Shewanella mangrovisoli]|uniref:Uncharacterized protein n=1 Tax=Shewanella mangrovisoli TaxID=2864211 RepID=A0ABV4VET5_9GAMM